MNGLSDVPAPLTPEATIAYVERLSPQPGDIVVIFTAATNKENIREITDAVATPLARFLQERKCMIMVLPMGMDLQVLNEEIMAQQGWIKGTKSKILVP